MLVFMFPGQNSRYAGMLDHVVEIWPDALEIIDWASGVLGRDFRSQYDARNAEAFRTNEDVQLGVFLTSYLYQRALAEHGVHGDLSLGLSLGEYNHLVHIGAIEFPEALRLVAARGRAYDTGPRGMMASVHPLPIEELTPYLEAARHHGEIAVATVNSPTQTVIGGSHMAVQAALRLIEEEEPGVVTVVIEQRLPMHTPMFHPVAEAFRPYLSSARWRIPNLPYISNVHSEGTFLARPGSEQIVELLARHIHCPVHWRHSMEQVVALHPDARFVEVGPGHVLTNLMQRRWLRNPRYITDHDDRDARLAALTSEIPSAAA